MKRKLFYDREVMSWSAWRFKLFSYIRKGKRPTCVPDWVYDHQSFKCLWFIVMVFLVFRVIAFKRITITEDLKWDCCFELVYN